jgi:hypothetical protein
LQLQSVIKTDYFFSEVTLFLLLMSSEIFEELPENQFSVLLFLAIGRFASG